MNEMSSFWKNWTGLTGRPMGHAQPPMGESAYTGASRPDQTMPTNGGINAGGGGMQTPMSSFWKNWTGLQGKPDWAGHEFGPTAYPQGASATTNPSLLGSNPVVPTVPTAPAVDPYSGSGGAYHTMLTGNPNTMAYNPSRLNGGFGNMLQQLMNKRG